MRKFLTVMIALLMALITTGCCGTGFSTKKADDGKKGKQANAVQASAESQAIADQKEGLAIINGEVAEEYDGYSSLVIPLQERDMAQEDMRGLQIQTEELALLRRMAAVWRGDGNAGVKFDGYTIEKNDDGEVVANPSEAKAEALAAAGREAYSYRIRDDRLVQRTLWEYYSVQGEANWLRDGEWLVRADWRKLYWLAVKKTAVKATSQ